jgi:hypothetical protein
MNVNVVFDRRAMRVAMVLRGVRSVARLGRLSRVSESYMRQIANGLVPSAEVRARIAATLGLDDAQLWQSPRGGDR